MPDILEGPEDSWLQRYTSNRIGKEEEDQIIMALKDQGLVLDHEDTLRWRDFPDKPSVLRKQKKPMKTSTADESAVTDIVGRSKTEREIFQPLGTVINAITSVPLLNLFPSCEYDEGPCCECDKYEEPPYEYDAESHHTNSEVSDGPQRRIHGFLRLIKSTSPPTPQSSRAATSDIAVNFEFRWGDTSGDIRMRKHTYSMTIEDNHVALWYFSRSHSAKSYEFDLLDVRAVVSALSALIFSTVEDLGYDTNIRRIIEWDQETRQDQIRYVYRLDDRFFKTVKCRNEYDGLYIAGRATRVWEVVEVASFNNTALLPNTQRMILRDVWLEQGSDTEREIQDKIFQRCDELGRKFPPENDRRLHDVDDATRTLLHQRLKDGSYKELFLTIKADYRGATSKPRAEGFTPAPNIFFECVYSNQEAKRHGSDAVSTSSTAAVPSRLKVEVPREYKPKQRNFVVYEEVCSALHELDDIYDVVQALLDAVLALQILFLISWIHRDVSSGNILFFRGRGKLSDLEYAKEFDLSAGRRSSDPKTATPIFTAVELQFNAAIYKDADFSEDMQDNETGESPPSLTVRHNFQHDLESIFWILAWLVFTHIPGQNCANVTAELFHNKRPGFLLIRLNVLTHHYVCAEWLQTLRPDLPPVLAKGLLTMRNILYQRYLNRGRSIGDMSTYSPIYDKFRNVLSVIAASVPRGRVRLVRPAPSKVGGKFGHLLHTDNLRKEMEEPEDNMLAPHKAVSLKRVRGVSDADEADD
ncbi:hypothetical protein C8Q70DRAFT_935688 [Cubamyces menziesii]|nr:hypothetical protein C8Q70DRAFT_935688 [Cubamyces menziesii]